MRPARSVLFVLLVGTAACQSKEDASPNVERVPVYYNSTERAARAARDEPVEAPAADERCKHAFASDAREMHTYLDTAFDPPMPALCTPIRCEKCGVVRHECVKRMRLR